MNLSKNLLQNLSCINQSSSQRKDTGKCLTNSGSFSYCDKSEKTTTQENGIMTDQATQSVKVKLLDQLVCHKKVQKSLFSKDHIRKVKDTLIDNSSVAQNNPIDTHSENKTISLIKHYPLNNSAIYKKMKVGHS